MNTSAQIKRMEFNTIKTIKLINKDFLLQKVFNNTCDKYNYNTLLSAAEANILADKTIKGLKDIYESIVLMSGTHSIIYNKIEIKNSKPRRYGKIQILADIKEQGTSATPFQETMLELADLKAITGTLSTRGVSDRFNGTEKLTDEKQRKIKAAIRDLKKKLEPILNSKAK
tara:strand:- start:3720 stop:4232 length:513 start_codon:yes stop_codon:yes gene_type:complete